MITAMPRYDRNNGVRVLYPKTEIVQVYLEPKIKELWLDLVEEKGFESSSEYIRLLIDVELDKVMYYVESENR